MIIALSMDRLCTYHKSIHINLQPIVNGLKNKFYQQFFFGGGGIINMQFDMLQLESLF